MTSIETHRGGTHLDKDPNVVPPEGVYVGVNDRVTDRLDEPIDVDADSESMDVDAGSSAANAIPIDLDVPSAGSADNLSQLDELDRPSSEQSRMAPVLQPPPPIHSGGSQEAATGKRTSGGTSPANDPREKFKEIKHDSLPPGIPVWVDALSKVDTTRVKFQEATDRLVMAGYIFPDFSTFLKTAKSDVFFVNWLVTRCAHISAVGAQTYTAHASSNQTWRTFLGRALKLAPNAFEGLAPETFSNVLTEKDIEASYGPPTLGRKNPDGSVAASASRRKKIPNDQRWKQILALFQDEPNPPLTPAKLFFHDHVIQTDNFSTIRKSLSPQVSAEIIWELCELNFRFELLALDRVLRPDLWVPENAAIREEEVQQVFFGDSVLLNSIPERNCGLAATFWTERIPFVTALRNIMKDWYAQDTRSQTRRLWSRFIPTPSTPCGEQELEKLESELAKLYCQTFFENFARAAICPRRIPVPKA